jgi:hypothetical protein
VPAPHSLAEQNGRDRAARPASGPSGRRYRAADDVAADDVAADDVAADDVRGRGGRAMGTRSTEWGETLWS